MWRLVSASGVLLALVLVAIPAYLSFTFARTLGGTPEEGLAYGIAAATIDVAKALAPLLVARWIAVRQWGAAVAAGLVFVAAVLFSITSAIGLAAGNRLAKSGSAEAVQAQFAAAAGELREQQDKLARTTAGRPAAEIDGALRKALAEPVRRGSQVKTVADWTDGCAQPDRAAVDACRAVGELRSQLAAATAREAIEARIAELRAKLDGLRVAGAGEGRAGDAQANVIARVWQTATGQRVSDGGVQIALIVLIAFVLEVGSTCMMYASLGSHGARPAAASPQLTKLPTLVTTEQREAPQRQAGAVVIDAEAVTGDVEGFCTDRMVPRPGHSMTLRDIETEYQAWCRVQGFQPLATADFRRELREVLAGAGVPVVNGRVRNVGFDDARPLLTGPQAA
jgi:hypothetical protein